MVEEHIKGAGEGEKKGRREGGKGGRREGEKRQRKGVGEKEREMEREGGRERERIYSRTHACITGQTDPVRELTEPAPSPLLLALPPAHKKGLSH